jgi:hypothetical protein
MKKLLIILLLFSFAVSAQTYTPIHNAQAIDFLKVVKNLSLPSGSTTTMNASAPPQSGGIFYNTTDGTIYLYSGTAWVKSSASFTQDVLVNIGAGKSVGKYVNGQTIPATGKTLDQFLTDIATEVVHPTYYPPTLVVNSSPSPGNYEIGTILSLTFSHTYTQNDAGLESAVVYYKNGTALGSNVDAITLTTNISYTVGDSYATGACKNNNLGVSDCVGQIMSGTATSGSIVFTPSPKRYWGYSASTPTDLEIRTSAGGGNELSTSPFKSSFNISVTGTGQKIFFAYPASEGTLNDIVVGGFSSLSTFTLSTRSFTNAVGYTQSFNIYTSNNTFSTGTISNIVTN